MSPETPAETQLKPADDNVQKITDWKDKAKQAQAEKKKRRLDKIQQKQHQIYMERRQRLINKGVDPKKVDLVIASEDYAEMPTEKKLQRLEGIINNSFQRLAQEIQNLRYNDGVLADSMDVNFKAFARMLTHLGLKPEDQARFIQEAQQEMAEERTMELQAKAEAEKKQQEEQEQQRAEKALRAAEQPSLVGHTETNNTPVAPPEGATEFGG